MIEIFVDAPIELQVLILFGVVMIVKELLDDNRVWTRNVISWVDRIAIGGTITFIVINKYVVNKEDNE